MANDDWKTVGIFVSVVFLIIGVISAIITAPAVFAGANPTGFIVAVAVAIVSGVAFYIFKGD